MPEFIQQALAEVDWARIDALTDEDIERAIAEDPDAAPIIIDTGIIAAAKARRS